MESKIKNHIVQFSHKLYAKGFVANHDGNISVKSGTKIIATPTAQSKGDVTEEMLVTLNQEGKKIAGTYNIFSEINLHLTCYHSRPDIQAIVHAHPPMATSFAVSQTPLQKIYIAEAIVTLGEEVPLICEKKLSEYLNYYDVFLLKNHGVLAVGSTLAQAYYRLELVEHLAKIEWYSKPLGNPKPLSQDLIQALLEKRQKAGLGRPKPPSSSPSSQTLPLDQIVAEEVQKFLSQNR
ncbi:MAG: hypothetical protein A2Z91_07945 [Deltaproteobacteria bacterium GWA2_38_16]|nr:MAG: hypothetical protein A2Z91_07945 [Deltaproteobacteria bacterium GWA2_38_16]OGQ03373.1 MAG: hypothetical protein A3D19_04565 [Deltaproteobacteria bacterium RIFCSPHIGHO2_02_FULL_38_15]OGQ33925.1 MAG: hypothetical protein A3A72_03975 [Deltaproteobacteria bacterium RIFCSPLOWO2_01_FULL_38_9]OGQ59545.1 MAG: hypothetical protein A3G92_04565 [Deltaproteobacteria bacterium RIFCSPLOWO2_12_FULL_38_8]HBQ20649.1 class II aldolase family protein [Deltaproteobacteria bacterium]